MATTPSTHSRTSSTSTTSSRSSSPMYRLFPRSPKPSHARHTSPPHNHLPQRQHQPVQPPQPSSLTSQNDHDHNRSRRRHTTTSAPSSQPPNTTNLHLTTSIERVTLPMLAHLNHQLNLARLEPERDRVRRQIQRQETVLTLSMLLKVWGDEGVEEERSRWSDDSEDEEEEDSEWED